MIQRIQTVYLLLAVILMIVCGCLPIGSFLPESMGAATVLYNLCLINGDTGSWDFSACGLFILLAAATVTSVINIFAYSNHKAQKVDCIIAIVCLVLWYALYALHITVLKPEHMDYRFGYAAILPFIAIILQVLARRGIVHDEKLLRSVDRIR